MTSRVHRIAPADIDRLARVAAGWLRERGVAQGSRVVVPAANDPRMLGLTHGALRSGIVPVIVNASLPAQERQRLAIDCDPTLIIDSLDQIDWDRPSRPGSDLAALPLGRPMLYTSGTTGRPKGVWGGVLSESLARAWAADEHDLWQPSPVTLVCSPLSHSAGHRLATAALVAGSDVILLDRFDATLVAQLLTDGEAGGTFLVPTHLRRIFALGDPPPARAAGRILHAGEPCPPALKRRALAWLPNLWEFYGSTEGQFTAISPDEWRERPKSVGRARHGRSVTLSDDDLVYVTAPPFARWQYWNDDAATQAAWSGDAFTAGDLGHIDADGYLTLTSRRDDLIITGGVNVYPAMVEAALLELPGIAEAAAFGLPDEQWSQRVCVAITLASDAEPGAIKSLIRERLTGPMRPKQILFLGELPRTASGKVDRAALRRLATEAAT